jgi:hypothetical protein
MEAIQQFASGVLVMAVYSILHIAFSSFSIPERTQLHARQGSAQCDERPDQGGSCHGHGRAALLMVLTFFVILIGERMSGLELFDVILDNAEFYEMSW